MKMAMVLVGEMFRLGGQGNRHRDTAESYDSQKSACTSHVKLAERLYKMGVDTDFFVESYSTKYESELRSWYGDGLIRCSLRKDLVGLSALAADGLSEIGTGYDCAFVCRIDLILKQMFIDMFDPNWSRVMFPSACWIVGNGHKLGSRPRVSDTMMFVPGRLVESVKMKFNMSHESWSHYLDSKILGEGDMGLMLDTYHDSDSAKDYNPIYAIANRHKSSFWHSMGYIVGSDTMPEYTEFRKKFPDWEPRRMLYQEKKHMDLEDMWEWWHKDRGQHFRFINLIRFSKIESLGQVVEYYNHRDQRYWDTDGDSIIVMDEDRKISSRLARLNDGSYSGVFEFNKEITFLIRRTNVNEWRQS
jgi:hypothetical protein